MAEKRDPGGFGSTSLLQGATGGDEEGCPGGESRLNDSAPRRDRKPDGMRESVAGLQKRVGLSRWVFSVENLRDRRLGKAE